MKIFIGTEPKTEIPRKVLEYSILKHCQVKKIQFIPMMGEHWEANPKLMVGTGFSLLRWNIPEYCEFKGFAIYMDADIICLDDISDLWRMDVLYPSEHASVWCTYQRSKWFDYPTPETSVMLINCERQTNMPTPKNISDYLSGTKDRMKYVKIMRALKHQTPPIKIPNFWNSLNVPTEKTKLLHYTKEPEQPWYNPKHKFTHIWEEYFKEALEEEVITKEEVQKAINSYIPHTKQKRGTGLHPYFKKYIT